MHNTIFAPLFNRKRCLSLDYGVMVAQQVLVLFDQVRVLVVQPITKYLEKGRYYSIDNGLFCIFLIALFLYLGDHKQKVCNSHIYNPKSILFPLFDGNTLFYGWLK